ncbi:type II toxin-antitoxin system RelE/ParE family toxin [Tunicatimonas pelagia]|uniref:type II toxin-antitoxin system RelE/ParE family toxin n=1 Tax=Tunicatimonas pelagia TaxID=931531 RepID=UPI002665FB8D|nr:type II toxin-antitoxin system RelE/ParE family toxin [Tunicatimonas pelagia]WKN46033.1 type II toxin-antitoxin system RelE/ParE family toxin [Tunicatimonas pelagia]
MNDYQVVILQEAQIDIEDTIEWYEGQRQGLGETFFSRYLYTEELLANNPYLYQENLLFVRRALISRTSYAIYYAVDEQNKIVEIIAVLHQKRDPKLLKSRINL